VADHPNVKNISVLLVLIAAFTIPALFLSKESMQDLVSVLMLVFACTSFYLVAGETWRSFWEDDRSRVALGLYGLFAVFLSVILTRTYGIMDRNVAGFWWVKETHTYSAFIFIQFVGLMMFARSSTPPSAPVKRSRWGQIILSLVIGLLIGSSKALEPILMWVGRWVGRF